MKRPLLYPALLAALLLAACSSDTPTTAGAGPSASACNDGIDNDADGKIDLADPGCGSAADGNETNPACVDGVDNDSDGLIDHPTDPGCTASFDDDETNPPLVGGNFAAFLDYGLFLNVLTPGQADCPNGGSASGMDCPDNFTDQQKMYENLAFTNPGQLTTVEQLVPEFFKTNAFVGPAGTPPADAGGAFVSNTPVSDDAHAATIKRDSFGVPHIYGTTRADVMFGTGYASGEDRLFVMDVLRHVGRGRQSDFIGGEPPDAYDHELAIKAGYDEQELQDQGEQLADRFGAEGAQALEDIENFVAGLNAYIATVRNTPNQPFEYAALNVMLRDFQPRDAVAIATLVQAIFAVGGGAEHRQAMLLREIEAQGGTKAQACQLWHDLRHRDDPEKQTTADDTFATQSPPAIDGTVCPLEDGFAQAYPGAALLDHNSLVYREPLTVTECQTPDPANALPPDPAVCPYFGEDVVDDEVVVTAAMFAPSFGPMFASTEDAPVVPWRGTAAELLTSAQRALGKLRAKTTVDGLIRAIKMGFPKGMSNALLVTKDQTASGRPLAVFGPQVGYNAPGLLMEISQQGGDLNSRGVTFAGLPYVLLGRGVDFAWSATSSVDDIIDIRVLQLCNPGGGGTVTFDSTGYMYNNVCKPMFMRTDYWTAEYNAGTPPPGTAIGKRVERKVLRAPDYGPVFAYAKVNDTPVALAIQRSTYFGEVDSAIPFVRTGRNEVYNPQSFFDAFYRLTGTFNWFYIDADNIAYFNSGLLPVRAAGVYPDLPTWGTGQFDWQQKGTGQLNDTWALANFLPLEAHPRQINPAKGWMVSWNNAQAPGFWAAEDMTAWSAVHRVLRLSRRLQHFKGTGAKHTPTTMVEIMEEAGSTDLRGSDVLPSIFAVLEGATLTTAQQTAITGLKTWVTTGVNGFGAHRRDRSGPGQNTSGLQYTHHDQVVLMDRWWNTMVDDVLPQIFAVEGDMISGRHDAPGPGGSAFFDGYYGYVRRVMDMQLGTSAHPYQQLKCAGTGVLADCRAALLKSLDEALAAVTGTERPEEYDAIVHTAVGAATIPDMHWIDRPTWQQVVQPTGHRRP